MKEKETISSYLKKNYLKRVKEGFKLLGPYAETRAESAKKEWKVINFIIKIIK